MGERLRLRFEKRGFLSRERDVFDVDATDEFGDPRHVTRMTQRTLGWTTDFELDGGRFTCRSKGFFSTRFVLELDGEQVVALRKRGSRSMLESRSGRDLALVKKGLVSPSFQLREDGDEVGRLTTKGLLVPVLHADLPGDTPLPVAVFLGFVCLMIKVNDED